MSRAAVAAMAAYTLELREADTKLNQNESPFDFPAELKSRVLQSASARAWNRYPDFESTPLREALARAYKIQPGNVLTGNGSNELLAAAIGTFIGPGTPVIVPRPTFTLYEKLVTVAGGTIVPVSIDPALGTLPADEIEQRATESSVIIVCSPNNPTGGVLERGAVDRFLATGATVLLDRAYGDFASDELLPLHDRLITFSTFSKAWGLAGLRVGWIASTESTCREIRKVKLPYSLNIISEEAAILALENRRYRDINVAHIVYERDRVIGVMRSIRAIEVFPTSANFIAFRTSTPSRQIFDALCARGILIRDISGYPSLANSLRVSIGTAEENDSFLNAIKEIA